MKNIFTLFLSVLFGVTCFAASPDIGLRPSTSWIGTNIMTVTSAAQVRAALALGEQTTNTTAAGWRSTLGLGEWATNLNFGIQNDYGWIRFDTAAGDTTKVGLRYGYGVTNVGLLSIDTSSGALELTDSEGTTPTLVTSPGPSTVLNYTTLTNDVTINPGAWRSRLALSAAATNTAGWLTTADAATARGFLEIPDYSLNDVMRTNAFTEFVTAGPYATNNVGDYRGTFINNGNYSTVPGWGSFFNTNDLTPFSHIVLPKIEQCDQETNIAWINVIVRNGKDSGSDIVAISRIEGGTDTTGLIAPLTNYTTGVAMTVNAGDLSQPFLVAFLPWSADGTPVDNVSRPGSTMISTNYEGNSWYMQGTNYAGTWYPVPGDHYIPFKFQFVESFPPTTNYVIVNGHLPAAITNEIHTATSDIDSIDARLAALEAGHSLAMPPTIWAVEGIEAHCYFAGLAPGDFRDWAWDATATGNVGTNHVEDWRLAPASSGTLALSVSQYSRGSANWSPVASGTNMVVIAAATATGTSVLLTIGDNTTDSANWLVPFEALDSSDTYVDVTPIGTQTDSGIDHEGHSGWSTTTFVGATSPFYDGAAFSANYYLTNNTLPTPTHVVIKLGINDLLSATSDAGAASSIATYIANMDEMVGSLTNDIASVKIGICLVEPCSRDQDAWGANYGSATFGMRARRNYWQLNLALISEYGSRTAEGIYVLPTNVCIDDYYGYSKKPAAVNSRYSGAISRMIDGVHPSTDGYEQIADCIWCWIKNNP